MLRNNTKKNVDFIHKLRLLSIENHIPKGNFISVSIATLYAEGVPHNFIRTHTKEKPFQCEFCEKVLQKKSRKNSYQRETISVWALPDVLSMEGYEASIGCI